MAELLFDKHILAGTVNGLRYERENRSERDVEIPPAFLITDADGGMWTFGGGDYTIHDGQYEFHVLRNDIDTGEIAKKIVYRQGVVTIYGYGYGRKRWTGRTFI
jgi:hypothetical protein